MRRLAGSALISIIVAGWMAPTMLSSAEAKDYYTRKRINGRWVEGYFPKNHSRNAVLTREVQPPVQPAVLPEPTRTGTIASILPFKLGLHFSPETPATSAQVGPQSVNGAEPQGEPKEVITGSTTKTYSAHRTSAERRERRRSIVVQREATRRQTVARALQKRERAGLQTTRLETRSFGRAEQHATSAALKSRDVVSASPTVSTQTSTRSRYELLAEALTAKAQALASGLITNVNQPLPAPRAEPVSVTYDYRTGIKTIAYASGAFNEEPFNLTAVRSLPTRPALQ